MDNYPIRRMIWGLAEPPKDYKLSTLIRWYRRWLTANSSMKLNPKENAYLAEAWVSFVYVKASEEGVSFRSLAYFLEGTAQDEQHKQS
jgi:hypothetical protein